jgi:hypothetical protein
MYTYEIKIRHDLLLLQLNKQMRSNKFNVFFAIIFVTLSSCTLTKNIGFGISNHRTIKNAKIAFNPDIDVSYIPLLEIIDEKVKSILDTAIYDIVNCKHYPSQMKYLYTFIVTPLSEKDGSIIYRISIDEYNEPKSGLEQLVGGFYYRNHLFIVQNGYHVKLPENALFFYKKECQLEVREWHYKLSKRGNYLPFMNFKKQNDDYKIIDSNFCGTPIIID